MGNGLVRSEFIRLQLNNDEQYKVDVEMICVRSD